MSLLEEEPDYLVAERTEALAHLHDGDGEEHGDLGLLCCDRVEK